MAGVIAKMKNVRNVNFLVGGDGPKRVLLEEIREKANMQDRVKMLGALEHAKVLNNQIYYLFTCYLMLSHLICPISEITICI